MQRNQILSTLAILSTSLMFVACSSAVQKGDISDSANPQQEITKLDESLADAVTKNIDVLAPTEYKSAVKKRDQAKVDLAKNEKQELVMDDLRTGRGFLDKANSVSENRASKAPGIFEARQAAIKAGASSHRELNQDLRDVDSDVSDKADDLSSISTDKLAKLQQRYVDLERRSMILTQLGNPQAVLNGAKKDNAPKLAPNTYKKAELSIKTAESVVSTNVRNPDGYKTAVAEAGESTALLTEVMNTIKQNKNLSESAALKMVAQNRQIKGLKSDLSDSATAESAMQGQNAQLSSDLATTHQNLNSAQATVSIQQALEKARTQFAPDEAEAYQQGGNLLIRMKQMNFASGRSDLPAASLASLAKVSEVAKSLNASEIKVEGHTDSVGTESKNKELSERRASAVATYLKSNGFENVNVQSEGYGFQKPIATNKSKTGRAQNRRVDIVITPAETAKSVQ